AGPLAGDRTRLDLEVGEDAQLAVRGVAASVLLPGVREGASHAEITASVASGGRLRWLPEPTVVSARADHHATATIHLAAGAGLVWREELALGRPEEPPGSLRTRLRVDLDGAPLLRSALAIGGSTDDVWRSPAILGEHRAVAQCLLV